MHLIDQELNCMLHGEFEEGWKICEELEKMGPDRIKDPTGKLNREMWTRHQFNRGWFLLQQGKFQEGNQILEAGRFLNVYGGGHLPTTKPIWKGEPLKDKTIILSLEGGFGDEIIHVRFAESLAEQGGNVIVAAAPEVHGIFSRVPGVSKVITRAKEDVDSNPHDYWMPGFSAGWVSGHTYESLPNKPYLFPLPESVNVWSEFIKSEKIKVGIRWSGNPKFEHQQFRQFDAKWLTDLVKYDELQLYSFQRDNDTRELDENIIDLQHILLSWEDTLAALSHMDLVITSCTSIAHAAAAMGKPTWVITPILPYHTWALGAPESNTSPWYDSVTLFRQRKFGEWDQTFEELYIALEKEFNLQKDENKILDVEYVEIKNEVIENINKEDEMKQNYVFIAGLPRSGGNIIQQVLSQNPKLLCTKNSGLFELISNVNFNWNNMGCVNDTTSKTNVLSSILNSYHPNNGGAVIEKHRKWINQIPMLEALLGQQVKIIVPVRNPAEILSAYEIQRKNNFLNPSLNDNELGSQSTITARCMQHSSPNGELGLSHAQTLDAVTSGFKDRLLFVDYNKFCNEPKSQLQRIYEFMEIDSFEHDVNDVKKDSVVPADVIGFDLYQQYNSQIFWQNWI